MLSITEFLPQKFITLIKTALQTTFFPVKPLLFLLLLIPPPYTSSPSTTFLLLKILPASSSAPLGFVRRFLPTPIFYIYCSQFYTTNSSISLSSTSDYILSSCTSPISASMISISRLFSRTPSSWISGKPSDRPLSNAPISASVTRVAPFTQTYSLFLELAFRVIVPEHYEHLN